MPISVDGKQVARLEDCLETRESDLAAHLTLEKAKEDCI